MNKVASDNPYPECSHCRSLEDCPHPDLGGDNNMSLPMIPDVCPRPIETMKATLKKHKITHKLIKEN